MDRPTMRYFDCLSAPDKKVLLEKIFNSDNLVAVPPANDADVDMRG